MHLIASPKTMVAVAVAVAAILAFALLASPGAPASSSAGDPLPNATPGPHGSNPPGYVFASGRS